jgi:hypothetical protein
MTQPALANRRFSLCGGRLSRWRGSADEAPVSVPGDVSVCDGDPRCAMEQRTDQVVSLDILQE